MKNKNYLELAKKLEKKKKFKEAFKHYKVLADKKNAEGQFQLGKYYINGIGTKRNQALGIKYYKLASDQGEHKAQNNLANLYQKGYGVKKDKKKAFQLYKKASSGDNDTIAKYNLAKCYYLGQGTKVNQKKAYELFKNIADKGNAKAQLYIFEMLYRKQGEEKNNELAKKYLELSVKQENGYAYYVKAKLLGEPYLTKNEKIPHKVEKKRFEYYKLAVSKLNDLVAAETKAYALEKLAHYYLDKKVINQNQKLFFKYLKQASELIDDPLIDYNMGVAFLKGIGIVKSKKNAIKYFIKASKNGHAKASYNLAITYMNGSGVKRDFKKSFVFLKKIIEENKNQMSKFILIVKYHLGVLYYLGYGGKKNKEKFINYFEEFEKNFQKYNEKVVNFDPLVKVMYTLAYCFSLGYNTNKNLKKGIFWAEKAAKFEYIYAQNILLKFYNGGFDGIKKQEKNFYKLFYLVNKKSIIKNIKHKKNKTGLRLNIIEPSKLLDPSKNKEPLELHNFDNFRKEIEKEVKDKVLIEGDLYCQKKEADNLEFKTTFEVPYPKYPEQKINSEGLRYFELGDSDDKSIIYGKRKDLHQFLSEQAIKAVAAMMNEKGGEVIIGINERKDIKKVIGIDYEYRGRIDNTDDYQRHIHNLIENSIIDSQKFLGFFKTRIKKEKKKNICIITCTMTKEAVWIKLRNWKDKKNVSYKEVVPRRPAAKTIYLEGKEASDFVANRKS